MTQIAKRAYYQNEKTKYISNSILVLHHLHLFIYVNLSETNISATQDSG